jgi:hypothetical protein
MNAVVINRDWYLLSVSSDHPALEKLRRFRHFQNGWAFGEGRAFTRSVIDAAEEIIAQLQRKGLSECDVFPGRNGQIIVAVYSGPTSLDFYVFADPHVVVTVSREVDGEEVEGDVPTPPIPLENFLLMLGGSAQWLSSESFTPTNLRAGNDVSRARLSNHQVTAPAYQSSNLSAQSLNLAHSAGTLRLATEV